MSRVLLRAFVVVSLVLGAGAGCGWLQQPCPCGQSFERDPWDDTTLGIGASHAVGVHCACRCGDTGELELEAPSSHCEVHEGECTLPSGAPSYRACE